ncbi:MAG: type II toxin-antitoxin system VapB family antitoxin [bacterium]|nr:type II toxin-antitoxin system VapB family antitoxin [bacterium]
MALSIKTQEADRLARDLSRLTGETMTQAVTVALRERLERTQAETTEEFVERVRAFAAKARGGVPFRPVTPEEWLDAGGDDFDHELAAKEKAQAQVKG